MKISNGKKELARIISENGGWKCSGEFSAQCRRDSGISFYMDKPKRNQGELVHYGDYCGSKHDIYPDSLLPKWHQTVLSRAEYFHLYPAPDADGWIEHDGLVIPVNPDSHVEVKYRNGSIGKQWAAKFYHWIHAGNNNQEDIIAYRPHKPEQSKSTAVGDDETNLAAKEELDAIELSESKEQRAKLAKIYAPSIESLAADYRNKLDYAGSKRDEADKANMEADAALSELEKAIAAIGFAITPIGAVAQEPELVITDWRELRCGDIVVITGSDNDKWERLKGCELEVSVTGGSMFDIYFGTWAMGTNTEWRFIRRP